MEINKILSADVLDIIFDDRNKNYGAYELRRSYHRRIKRALAFTFASALLIVVGAAWASGKKSSNITRNRVTEVTLIDIKPDEKKIEQPKPIERTPPPQVQLIEFTPPVIKPNDEVENPPPQVEDLETSRISDVDKPGIEDTGIPEPDDLDDGRGIIPKKPVEDDDHIYPNVQVEASFPGGEAKWRQYLERNCNGQVATDNGAPEGRYTIIVQFVVDKEGNISDVHALTNYGYGMEEESVRVIKKGPNWNAAFQNGIKVKAYRKQPITFQVTGEQPTP